MDEKREALERLKESLCSKAAAVWLDAARIESDARGRTVLRVAGPFQKRWFEDKYAAQVREAFGGTVRIVADGATARPKRHKRAAPRLRGPAGEFAVRMVRAFVEGEGSVASCVVLHGAARSGKSVLVDWACSRAGDAVFRLDLARVRRGHSRGLIPRKPLVIADGLETLAGRRQAQRTLCTILDAVLARGHRFLGTVEGHPGSVDFEPPLKSRLLGGLLVPVVAERTAEPDDVDDVDESDETVVERMKDVAARLFRVERDLMDGGTKRRTVVAARRTVIAAACRGGLDPSRAARACGIRSSRSVREACRWVALEAAKDDSYAALLGQVARVLAKP